MTCSMPETPTYRYVPAGVRYRRRFVRASHEGRRALNAELALSQDRSLSAVLTARAVPLPGKPLPDGYPAQRKRCFCRRAFSSALVRLRRFVALQDRGFFCSIRRLRHAERRF